VNWGHWFAFFNIVAAMLIGTSYITSSAWPDTLLGQLYLVLSWVGHFGFLVFALYILILFPLTFIVPSRKLLRFIAVIVATCGLSVLLLDVEAYQSLHLHLNPIVWEVLLNQDQSNLDTEWQSLFIAVPLIFMFELVISEWIWRKQRKLSHKRVGRPIGAVFFVCFIASHCIYIWADATFYQSIVSQRANFPLSYPMTAKSFLEKQGWFDRGEYLKKVERGEAIQTTLNYPLAPIENAKRANNYNVLMIQVGSLRSDAVTETVMPNLHQFARQSQQFNSHYAGSNDRHSDIGLMYGIPATYTLNLKHQNVKPLLIEQFEQYNYKVGLFSSHDGSDDTISESVFGSGSVMRAKNDRKVTAELTQWISSSKDSSWGAFVQLADLAEFEQRVEADPDLTPTETLRLAYREAASTLDQQLGAILDTLKESDGLENTVVIITSNHGWEFNETRTNSWGSNSNYSRYQVQVPLIMHWPNTIAQEINYPTSHFDVSVTLMQDLFSITNNPMDYSSGQNLFSTKKRTHLLAGDTRDIAIITVGNTIVLDRFGNYKLYDSNYRRQHDAKPKLSLILRALGESKRFYQTEE
jgi:membrane-anchored protein YejM (alkaline phosphatase superfamily)